jgi:hypothetical protein
VAAEAVDVAPRTASPAIARAPLVVHLSSLAVAAVVLVWYDRHAWFWADEWDLINRSLQMTPRLMFEAHNAHWSTLPLLLWWPLVSTVGLRSYWPYLAPLLVVHLGLAHVVWRVMTRSGQNPWLATGLVAAFAVLGVGATNINSALQISFVGSVLLGYSALLVTDRETATRRDYVVCWLLLILSTMSSGIGVVMTLAACLVALIRRGWWAGLLTAAIPGAIYVVWYESIGQYGSPLNRAGHGDFGKVPRFVLSGLENAFARPLNLPQGLGLVPFVALVVYLIVRARRHGLADAAIAYAALATTVVLYVVVASGRAQLRQLPEAQRYAYVCVALYLPAAGLALDTMVRRLRQPAVLVVPVAVALVAQELSLLSTNMARQSRITREARSMTLAAAVVAREDPWLGPQRPYPAFPSLTMDLVRTLDDRGALPSLAGVTPQQTLAVRSVVQVIWYPTFLRPRVVFPVAGTSGARLVRGDAGCVEVIPTGGRPQLTVTVDTHAALLPVWVTTPGQVELTLHQASASGEHQLRGSTSQGATVSSPTRSAHVTAEHAGTWWIGVQNVSATLGLPAGGPSQVCGVSYR